MRRWAGYSPFVGGELDREQVRLAELVGALSLGIDLGFGQPMEHVLRQCLIALRLGQRMGLDDEERALVRRSLQRKSASSIPSASVPLSVPAMAHLSDARRQHDPLLEGEARFERAPGGARFGDARQAPLLVG
jgi:hypothetical protein